MTEERRGEEWTAGTRVKVWNQHETPGQFREGVIISRSWGRDDRRKPIYWFIVRLDGSLDEYVFGPGQLQKPEA